MFRIIVSGLAAIGFCVSATMTSAGMIDHLTRGKPDKLGAPQNVVCTKSAGQAMVSWEPVVGALNYRVMVESDDAEIDAVETVSATEAPPYSFALDAAVTDAEVKVRAMMSKMGKNASKPSKTVTCQ
jgi:hypothetical protein